MKEQQLKKSMLSISPLTRKLIFIATIVLLGTSTIAQEVSVCMTKGDQTALLEMQNNVSFSNGVINNREMITIDESMVYQDITGFGYTLTEGSAEVFMSLSQQERTNLLNELFHPDNGNNLSVIRISIGASDLSSSTYSYHDDSAGSFSLDGPDKDFLIPVLQEMLNINSNIKILATPWSAPRWMKTNNSWIGGSLNTEHYDEYATYFVEYINAMKALNIPIWAITPQNEPENPYNEPSMLMNASEQLDFINNHLGPAIAASGNSVKIIGFDHNCDNTSYPISVANGSSYVDGSAFHLYAGNISAMSTVKEQTGKDVYFTEQWTGINGSFDGDLAWHMENIVTGSLRNWSKSVLIWNLADFPGSFPRTPGGCDHCLGAITVDGEAINRNVAYYIIAQISKFVDPGAQRIESTYGGRSIHHVALKNPDGSNVLLVYNGNNRDKTVTIAMGNSKSFAYTLPARTAITFKWNESTTADNEAPSVPTGLNSSNITNTSFTLSWSASSDNVAVSEYDVYKDGNLLASTSETSYNVTGLTADTQYSMTVSAKDAAGNESAQSSALNVTTDNASGTDTEAPSTPTNLVASATSTTIDLSWDASTDNVAVTGYNVYLDGIFRATTQTTTYQFTGLTKRTSYSLGVVAFDLANNESEMATINKRTSAKSAAVESNIITKKSVSFTVFPNPVADLLNVSFTKNLVDGKIQLITTGGKEVIAINKINTNNIMINMTNIPKGAYILVVSDINGKETKRILKK